MAAIAAEATTRERLLAAALVVFRRDGYERARVQDIAREAGLTTGAIYANWRGKGDLLLEAIAAGSAEELDTLLRVAGDLPSRDLLAVLGARMAFREHERPLLLDAVVAGERDEEVGALLRGRIEHRHEVFGQLLERGVADGSVDPDLDLEAVTRFCMTLAFGSLVVRALQLPPPDPDAWDTLIDRLLEAIAPRDHEDPGALEET
jgi:AcrR family transcriptional regulator